MSARRYGEMTNRGFAIFVVSWTRIEGSMQE